MSVPIIKAENIGKSYRINHEAGGGYTALRDVIAQKTRSIFKRATNNNGSSSEEFWALKDVSFEIQKGDAVGIIGRNGAGKSTLLKILSRITEPTKGRITLNGRIASLLEVGTGFHPELTGRENIFLNGAILGMSGKEVRAKFDEIVDFSGVERFLDTPVKRYSSGMYVRLAFAVAAHLEPEILVVDEVLAVGDAEFQKKCLGKMENVSKSGRTVLFVSHNMAAIESLCSMSILLKGGMISDIGDSRQVIQNYLDSDEINIGIQSARVAFKNPGRLKPIKLIEVFCDGKLSSNLYMGCNLEIKVHFKSPDDFDYPILGVVIKDSHHLPLIGINHKHYTSAKLTDTAVSEGTITMKVPYLTLFEGTYYVDVHFGNGFSDIQIERDCLTLIVEALKFSEHGELPDKSVNRVFIPNIDWILNKG